MSVYRAPLQDMQFVLNELAGLEQELARPDGDAAPPHLAYLTESGTLATRRQQRLKHEVMALVAVTGAPATRQATRSATGASVVISTRTLPKLGTVLVNGKGLTLYMFVPDKQAKVTCVRGSTGCWSSRAGPCRPP